MAGFHTLAKNLLTKFGFNVTLTNYSNDDFDIETGDQVKTISSIDDKAVAVFTSFDSGSMKEFSYVKEDNDKQILLNCDLSFLVSVVTSLKIQDKYYKVVFFQEVKDVLDTAVYKVVIREDSNFIDPE